MRRFITLFAAVTLPLFMISTSIAASVCDLSCWFRQAQSGCHTPSSPTAGSEMAMSMPADMDMGLDQSDSMAGPDPVVTTMSHSMSMPSQMQLFTGRSVRATNNETSGTSMPDHSKGTLCIHQICAQVGTSRASSDPGRFQSISLHSIAINATSPRNSRIHFPWLGSGSPPPKTLTVGRLTATLRI